MDADISSQSSAIDEESFLSQEGSESKTSSSRRKLRMPKKNAQLVNKTSPGKRRKSRRNLGLGTGLSKKDLEIKVLESID